MKYKYSERYQEAAIINHKGTPAIHAAVALKKYLADKNKPVLGIIAYDPACKQYICLTPNNSVLYGNFKTIGFQGFGAACLGADNHYSDVINRYKLNIL